VDPLTAARLAPNDAQRIGRALEVYRATGQPLSAFHSRKTASADGLQMLGQPGLLLSLEPSDRAWLHQRIEQRFDTMLAQGFLDEVLRLRQRPDLHPGLPAIRCVGYRQAWEAFDAHPDHGATLPGAALRELRDRGVFATRQLAKRQLTWLRSMPQRQVVHADTDPGFGQALATVQQWLAGAPTPQS